MDTPGRQKGNKGPRRHVGAIPEEGEDNHDQHQRIELRTVITTGKWRTTQEDSYMRLSA
jgi:hypothetical protein